MSALVWFCLAAIAQAPPSARSASATPAVAPSMPQSVSPIVSVAAAGANGDPANDATAAFEAALTRAGLLAARPATSASPPTSLVRVPGGAYAISRPLFVPPGVDLAGDGWATRIEMAGQRRLPVLIYGIADPQVREADRPDLYGVLDRTAAPRPGARRGWSTLGGRALQAQFTSANVGRSTDGARDYWEGVRTFTLDVALGRPDTGWGPNRPLLGCGQSVVVNAPEPWTLWTSPRSGWVTLHLATNQRVVGLAVPLPSTRIVHMSWQVDLGAGRVAVWINGVQVAVEADGLAPGQSLKANTVWPLHVGRQGFGVATTSEPPTGLVLAGFHLAAVPRYAVGAIGSTQTRLDRRPVDDAYRYFDRTDQVGTVGFLPFDDPPGQRWLRWVDGDGLDELFLVMRSSQGGVKPARLSDLSIWSRGPAVLLGAVLDWRGNNLRLQSESGAALGSVPIVMAYPITLYGCTLLGGDAAVSLSQALVALRDCKIEGQGRDAIRLRGASIDVSNVFSAFCPPHGRTFLRSMAGGEGDVVIRIDRAIIDFEDRGPSDAMFVIDAEPQHPTRVRLLDISAALTGPNEANPRPVVILTDRPTSGVPASCHVEGVASGKRLRLVEGGKGWTVKASEVSLP